MAPEHLGAPRRKEEQVRDIALDVHIDFCEVAIADQGGVRSAGRIETKPEQIELFAQSLHPSDRVALEVTGNAWEIKRIIEPHVAEVIVFSPNDTGIRGARAKTDRLDARTLARLLAAGELDSVWVPDRATWRMRRRLQRRGQLVWARSRAKNQIHATLMRSLVGRAPFSDLFGVKGRRWLAELELPTEERESVDSAMRQIEFLDSEIEAVERLIAAEALESPEIRRLMTVPGVNVICAATFMAAIGEIDRFASPRKLTGYLGLDPRVSQSGSAPATHGRISKQGSMRARHALVEASWSTVRQPGPMHAFYERIRARRGHSVAIVAAARKLACLFWCLLTRAEDYAYQQPSLTAKKLRLLEIRAGAKTLKGTPRGHGRPGRRCTPRSASWRRRPRPPTGAASATGTPPRRRERAPARHRGAHLVARQAGKQRGRSKPLGPLFSSSSTDAHRKLSQRGGNASSEGLTFMRRPFRASRAHCRDARNHARGRAPAIGCGSTALPRPASGVPCARSSRRVASEPLGTPDPRADCAAPAPAPGRGSPARHSAIRTLPGLARREAALRRPSAERLAGAKALQAGAPSGR
jgi:transposase